MKISKDAMQFNQEMVFGEIGAIIGGPMLGLIISFFTDSPKSISFSAVIGSMCGSTVFWLYLRIKNGKKRGDHSNKKLAKDIMYITPFAFTTVLLVYQPILYLLSKKLLIDQYSVLISVISAQIIAYASFIIIINLYRILIIKATGRKI